MAAPRKYLAGWVPRFMRQTKLGHLPLDAVICSQTVQREDGQNVYMDMIMLPVQEFQRMQGYIGLQHVASPVYSIGKSFDPVFSIKDIKQITVPEDELDPRTYAREYFLAAFGVLKPTRALGIEDKRD